MKKFEYTAIKVNHTPNSAQIFLLSVMANELVEWSSVPRKKDEFTVGYQRNLDDKKVKDITEFLETDHTEGKNIIPSAVLVAVKGDCFRITEEEAISQSCKIEITVKKQSDKHKLNDVLKQLKNRLGTQTDRSTEQTDRSTESNNSEIDVLDSNVQETIEDIEKKLSDENFNDDGDLVDNARDKLTEYIDEYCLPGMIIDGQHRVFGANEVEDFEVYLPLVLILDMEPVEQAFHFWVVNNKAKSFSSTALRQVLNTSFTNNEFKKLKQRLITSGVDTGKFFYAHLMNISPESPFQHIINLKDGKDRAKPIKENVAHQLATAFLDRINNTHKILIERSNKWISNDQEYRMELFFSLWSAVRTTYKDVWDRGRNPNASNINGEFCHQIFMKVCLLNLQKTILDHLVGDERSRRSRSNPAIFDDRFELERETGAYLSGLHENFFIIEWRTKQLDTKNGHEKFFNSMDKAIKLNKTKRNDFRYGIFNE